MPHLDVRIQRVLYVGQRHGEHCMLMGIGEAQVAQASLLTAHGADERSKRLMQVMDALNARYGRNTVFVFSSSSPKLGAMRREKISPCYTTRWSDLPVARAC